MHDIAMQNICITLHNLFGFLAFFIAVQFPRGSVLVTEVDRYLANYVIKSFSSNDWLSCTLACQDDTTCVSYNYDMNTGFCELNNEGIQTQFVQTDLLFTKRGVVFHQIRPAKNTPLPRTVDAASQCDCRCRSESACRPGDVAISSLPVSCKEIWEKSRIRVDGSFFIRAKSPTRYAHVFCHMTPIPGCGDGGWTLVMKIDGNKQTFKYDSAYWGNTDTYNESAGTSLKEEETKLSSFWSTPFRRLCLGMKDALGKTSWISLKHNASSLRDVISNGTHRGTNLTVTEWKSLLNNSKIGEGCTLQGFNTDIPSLPASGKARIGIIGFRESLDCDSGSASSRIGFGTGGGWRGMQPSNSCGNEWEGDLSKKAFGYIFVQ